MLRTHGPRKAAQGAQERAKDFVRKLYPSGTENGLKCAKNGQFCTPKGPKMQPACGKTWRRDMGRAPLESKTPPASSPTSPNGAQARVHNACARSFHLAAAAQRNTMNAQAPAGTRICACVREIAGPWTRRQIRRSWTKWTLKRPPAPTFARVYVRDTSTKADASRAGLVLRTPPPWRQAKAARPPGHRPPAAASRAGATFRTSTKDSQAIVEDAASGQLEGSPGTWTPPRTPAPAAQAPPPFLPCV